MFNTWRRRTEENQLGTLEVIRESIQDKIEELRGPQEVISKVGREEDDVQLAADIAAWRAAKARRNAQRDQAILLGTNDASEDPVATGRDLGAAKAQEASTNASGDSLAGDK
ncbi:hypothetical protein P167DRAFT_572202 [Morchella conica CCBAS932]|uniref:Uncharacterized protein n=1 Tax=Morchella conica CCBAS932 TaxID=1392247 RepID=A0A3N4KYH5_9PEZI|nr:hypothetical protein P167DRAFT_572202 [Morchella conica CCBAS932]